MECYTPDFGKVQREMTDPLKRNYCTSHNILLFEIRYDADLDKEIDNIMSHLSISHADTVPSRE